MSFPTGKLYLCGGIFYSRDQHVQVPYDTYYGAQLYNPQHDLWQELLPLEREISKKRIRVGRGRLITLDGFLLILDDDVGKHHHLYNPVTRKLTRLIQSHGHHWFAGWAVLDGQLVCAGGVEDARSGVTDMVHAWDLTVTNQDNISTVDSSNDCNVANFTICDNENSNFAKDDPTKLIERTMKMENDWQNKDVRRKGWYMLPPLPRPMSHHVCLNMFLPLNNKSNN